MVVVIKDNQFNYCLIGAVILTIILCFLFIYLWPKDGSLQINEIGDALSGLSTTIAFLWIIVGIFLQREELKIQHHELKEVIINAKMQSESLQESLKCQVLETLRLRFKDKGEKLNRVNNQLENIVHNFVRDYGGIDGEVIYKFENKASQSIAYPLRYFFKSDVSGNVDIENLASFLKNDFEFAAFRYLQDILEIIDEAWDITKPEFVFAADYDLLIDCESWIACCGLIWTKSYYKFMKILSLGLEKIIADGGSDNEFAGEIILADIKSKIDNRNIEIPFEINKN